MRTTSPYGNLARPGDRSALWAASLAVVVFLVLWADMIRMLSWQWDARDRYAYGWFVPLLAAGLFWRRWKTRPFAQPAPQRLSHLLAAAAGALILLPLRVLYEINPDWPLCSWLMAATVIALSLYALFLAGGRSWAAHFAFPLCFILVAVVWPFRVEHSVIQGLSRAVSVSTVEVLGWLGLPALQRGNVIEISGGVVGINEACSGIRSFQSSLMGALFFGELFRLNRTRRVVLLLVGITLAFGFNVVRTLGLTWKAATSGTDVSASWHDPAGFTILGASFLSLWGIASFFNHRNSTLDSAPRSFLPARCPALFLALTGGWAVCVLLFTEVWYRTRERSDPGGLRWTAQVPTNAPGFEWITVDQSIVKHLRCDQALSARWRDGDAEWNAYYFRWNPASIETILNARSHRPDHCLPASGFRQVSSPELVAFSLNGVEVSFRHFIYQNQSQTLDVFFCQWEDGRAAEATMRTSARDRFQAVWSGRRRVGRQTLELVVSGYPNLPATRDAVKRQLASLMIPASPVSSGPAFHHD